MRDAERSLKCSSSSVPVPMQEPLPGRLTDQDLHQANLQCDLRSRAGGDQGLEDLIITPESLGLAHRSAPRFLSPPARLLSCQAVPSPVHASAITFQSTGRDFLPVQTSQKSGSGDWGR